MRAFAWTLCMGCLLAGAGLYVAGEEPPSGDERAVAAIAAALETLVRKDYPKARLQVVGTRIHLEHDARDFRVHHPGKDLEWGEAVKERGPRGRGFVIEARYAKGRSPSQLATGAFDERYYLEHRMRHYDEGLDRRLHLVLRLPTQTRHPTPRGFAERVRALVLGFAEHVDP